MWRDEVGKRRLMSHSYSVYVQRHNLIIESRKGPKGLPYLCKRSPRLCPSTCGNILPKKVMPCLQASDANFAGISRAKSHEHNRGAKYHGGKSRSRCLLVTNPNVQLPQWEYSLSTSVCPVEEQEADAHIITNSLQHFEMWYPQICCNQNSCRISFSRMPQKPGKVSLVEAHPVWRVQYQASESKPIEKCPYCRELSKGVHKQDCKFITFKHSHPRQGLQSGLRPDLSCI